MADEDEIDPALPVPLSAQRRRADDDDELRPHTFETLKYEQVLVRASGFLYRGTLIGADESDLYLKTETRWVVLPLDRVTSVAPDDARDRPLGLPSWLDDEDAGA
jgi:hypothetical protein